MLVTWMVVVRGVKLVFVACTVRVCMDVDGMIWVITRVVVRVNVLVVQMMLVRCVVRVWNRLLMLMVVLTTVVVRVMVLREVVVELIMILVERKSVNVVTIVKVVRDVLVMVLVVVTGDVVRIVDMIVRVVNEVKEKVRTVVLVIVVTSTHMSSWARTDPIMNSTTATMHQMIHRPIPLQSSMENKQARWSPQ